MQLITIRPGQGQLVRRVYIEEGADIARASGVVLDREKYSFASWPRPGRDRDEEVAETHPENLKEWVDLMIGLAGHQARSLAFGLGGRQDRSQGCPFHAGALQGIRRERCSLAEINPLIITGDGDVIALDAKINFDGNVLGMPRLMTTATSTKRMRRKEASKYDLVISLDGSTGWR